MSKASRKYEAGVERALGLFDTTNEWADYIAFLSRLHRALQVGPEGADIPLKHMVARYLAQCLTPALPSGVHQKTLEVYASIFSIIGKDRLARDLALYLPGVSHTLSFGSLSVRPLFLLLIRDHILRLPPTALRPALKAILLSLLPGLEDESTEDFETTLATVSEIRIIFAREGSEGFFWQSLFLVTITSPNRRPGAFVYLVRHLPKLRYHKYASKNRRNSNAATEDPLDLILSPEPGLLIRCFAAGLLDDQILVQRNFLDLLVTHLPIGALAESKRVSSKDIEILVSAAVSVVLRRDMSLNKRLWSWFLGPENQNSADDERDPASPEESKLSKQLTNGEISKSQEESYFSRYSLTPLIQSLQFMIAQESRIPSERARPYRIALSLMDRWEIGGPAVAATFLPLMRSLQVFQPVAPSQEVYQEVFRSANVFFDGVESNLIWTQLFILYQQNDWDLLSFVISRFNLEEEEMLILHLPLFAVLLVDKLASFEDSTAADAIKRQIQTILATIMNLIPERAYGPVESNLEPQKSTRGEVSSVEAFYNIQNHDGNTPKPPLSRAELTELSLRTASNTFIQYLVSSNPLLYDFTQLFLALISNAPSLKTLRDLGFLSRVEEHLRCSRADEISKYQLCSISIGSVLVAICTHDKSHTIELAKVQCLVRHLVSNFWKVLSPESPQFHVESVQHLLSLHGVSEPSRTVESSLVSLVTAADSPDMMKIERWNVLWNHAGKDAQSNFMQRPLLCVVDKILVEDVSEPAKAWVRNLPLTSLEIIYRSILQGRDGNATTRLLGILAIQTDEQWLTLATEEGVNTREALSTLLRESLESATTSLTDVELDHKDLLQVLSVLRLLQNHHVLLIEEPVTTGFLMNLLENSPDGSQLQHSLLETLQEMALGRQSSYPPEVLTVLLKGITTAVDESVDLWMSLTCAVVMLYDDKIFQVILKVTDCFCTRLSLCLSSIQRLFDVDEGITLRYPEKVIVNILGGLEYILAKAHQRISERERQKIPKSPDQPQGLFGSMVPASSQSITEEKQLRSSLANDRLTVILCFQDAAKLCYRYWSWGAASHPSIPGTQASQHHVASKIRSRSRRILDNLLDAEPQECLETLIGLWTNAIRRATPADGKRVLNLLQSLKGGRPRLTLPTAFNAIYNRTNPTALDKSQKSTMSTNLSAVELATFLTEYTASLEDDLVEEIWADCTTFLREVLGNPMPHRQILLHLLEFIAVLCKKIENTNFGEEYKMRKELGDICLRLFTAIFTLKPGGLETGLQSTNEDSPQQEISLFDARSLLQVLSQTLPSLSQVLTDSDRFTTVLTGIATNITGPLLRSKNFPQNISTEVLLLLQIMGKPASLNKGWRKDVFDAFNDARFFSSPVPTVKPGWLPLIRQIVLSDKTLLSNMLSQLGAPTTAGLMFGVGAATARTEADKRAQGVLRRIALLYIAAEADTLAGNVGQVHAKVEQLFSATKESSPSSAIRGDIYMLLRAIILTTSPIHLALLWPTIDSELRDVFSPTADEEASTNNSAPARLQAAKLLDLLLLLKPDEFQLHEWLFVTDTVDAIYPPANFVPSSLSDILAQTVSGDDEYPLPTSFSRKLRKPWLCSEMSREISTENIDAMLLQPFFRQLSIHAFEDAYSLSAVDKDVCVDDLIADIFNL